MADFADCSSNFLNVTPAQLCEGFSPCAGDGVPMNSAGLNGVVRWLEDSLSQSINVVGDMPITVTGTGTVADPFVVGLDITDLLTTLCANVDFQNCVSSIADGTGPVPIPPSSPGPWTLTGVEGLPLAQTNGTFTGTAPISLTVSGLPAGVTFNDNGNGTFTLGGVFPAAGSVNYTVTATNTGGSNTGTGTIQSTAISLTPAFTTAVIDSITDEGFYNSGNGWPGALAASNAGVEVGLLRSGAFGFQNSEVPLDEVATSGAPVFTGVSHNTDVTDLSYGHDVETQVSQAPTAMRIVHVSGDFPNEISPGYIMDSWVPFTGTEIIFANYRSPEAITLPPDPPSWQLTGVLRVELDFAGTILSAEVTLLSRSFNGVYI